MIKPILRCAAMGALTLAAQAADFSYYMLSLAWTPNYCVTAGARDLAVCGPGRRFGFVVRGLSPLTQQGTALVKCAPGRPLPADVVRSMLTYIPSEPFVRQEWATHGACSGLEPSEYFALVRQLRDSVRLPRQYEDVREPVRLPPQTLGNDIAQTNPGIPRDGIRVACSQAGLLEEVRICFDRKGIARACTGVPECTKLAIGLAPMQPPRLR
jgi:ribonuclease T2